MFKPSKYQKKIFEFITNGSGNAVVSAVAGSGKTTTLLKALEIIPSDKTVLFLAFNKNIADELKTRIPVNNNIKVSTVHGFGFDVLSSNIHDFKLENVDKLKYRILLKHISDFSSGKNKSILQQYKFNNFCMEYVNKIIEIVSSHEDVDGKKFIKDTLSLCNLGRLDFIDTFIKTNGLHEISKLANIHSINNENGEGEVAWYLINLGLHYIDKVDFTDMVYLPNALELETNKYDFVFIDECQDLNTCQRLLMQKAIKPDSGRFLAVGDPKQAIYAFAGADYESYQKLCNIPNTIELPLSETYRCGSDIISMVKHINPNIKSHKKNGKGEVLQEYSYRDVQDGDMILCRQTFPVVSLCIRYLSEGKRAYIIGSDIGISLITMIEECEKNGEEFNMENVFSRLYHEKGKLIDKIIETHFMTKDEANEDPVVIIYSEKIQVIEALSLGITDPNQVIEKIKTIFSDKKKVGICLSNIHKSKGLEAERVFILQRDLMPSKYAVLPWQVEQEKNLMYVAYTRAKKTLGFISDYDAFMSHKSQSQNVKKIQESKHIGGPGMKMWLELEIINIRNINGAYGETLVYEMKDKKNCIFSKFGTIDRRYLVDGNSVGIGSKVEFYGIIKQHSEFKGVKITQLGKITEY
jgi:DNA helicase-2/ATP-dependent DNA helicase PcrA